MKKLSISPSIARADMVSKFSAHLNVIALLNSMQDSQVVVLSSLMDGSHLTSAGNGVPANFEVTRLSAIIEVLEKKYFFPIVHSNVSTTSSTTGRKTVQTVYFIDHDDIERLLTAPDFVFENQRRAMFFRDLDRERKVVGRLIEKKGSVSKAVLSLMHHVYKDKPLSDETWKGIENKFTHILNELNAA